jgi:hypothetical protein
MSNQDCANTTDYLDGWDAAKRNMARQSNKSVAWTRGYDDYVMQPQFEPCYNNVVEYDEDEL